MHSDEISNILSKVASLSGDAKKRYLVTQPEVGPYLLATYDPFTNYFITPKALNVKAIPPAEKPRGFNQETWMLLNALSNRGVTGNAAIDAARREYAQLTEKSRQVFLGILDKNFRIGLAAKSINEVFKNLIPVHEVMLAKMFEAKRVKFPCYSSVKIDGVRATYMNGKFYSRNGIVYTGLNHISIPEGLVVDGELTVPGMSFQEGSGLIRSDDPTPMAIFNMFEMPKENMSFADRLNKLEGLVQAGKFLKKVPHKVMNNMQEIYEYYALCRNRGFEGSVVKPLNYSYRGTRSYDWMKLKPRDSADLQVVGVYEGNGKYTGMLGGVYVVFNNNADNKVGSGFSDAERKRFWERPDLIMNKIIEVDYMEETDDGNLRHASYKGIRHDKEVGDE